MKKWIIITLFFLLVTVPALAVEDESTLSPGVSVEQNNPAAGMPDDSTGQAHRDLETIGGKTTQPSREEQMRSEPSETLNAKEEAPGHGFGHKLLFYIPNRIVDVFDFVRLRVRVGPGLAVGARVTRPLTLSIGGYTSIYVGLPGPRLEPTIKLPFGIENYAGMEVSVLNGSTEGKFTPNYSATEIGVSVHPLVFGLDICVDPLEVVDLALGFLFIDIRGDDF